MAAAGVFIQSIDRMGKKSFRELINEAKVPVLVDVYSDNCGPCQAMKPVLKELKERMGDGIKIIKIDGYSNVRFMQDFKIQAFPTLMIFVGGRMVWSRMGYTTASMLEKMVKAHAVPSR